MQQFRGIEILHVIKRAVPPNQSSINEDVAPAELALKAHVLASSPAVLAEINNGESALEEIANAVNLTEAPEDAVCALVTGLIHYCEREGIDWTEDVMERARKQLDSDERESLEE